MAVVQASLFGAAEFDDPVTKQKVPFAEYSDSLVRAIRESAVKVVDVETTGLNPSSSELAVAYKDLMRGSDAELRLRVTSILWFDAQGAVQVTAFDMDRLTLRQKEKVCDASLTGVFIAHNAGFDLYWLRTFSKTTPKLVIDTMLLARVLASDIPLIISQMAVDEAEDPDFREAAFNSILKKKSGWALAEVTMVLLRKMLPKEMQGPRNWTEFFLTQKHYDYATMDVITTYDVILQLFSRAFDTEVSELPGLAECYYMAKADDRYRAALVQLEPQVMDLVEIREHGMPINGITARKYAKAKIEEGRKMALKMCEIEPDLEPYVDILADPDRGLTVAVKNALADAFRKRGITPRETEKTGLPQVGEKDLRLVGAQASDESRPLFDAWVNLSKSQKAAAMALEVAAFSERSGDGKVHSMLGHGPVTGRLSAAEPNVQQFPGDPLFREIVEAPEGYLILADDFSALDVRVASALCIRAQREISKAYWGEKVVAPDVLQVIRLVYDQGPEKAFAVSSKRLAGLQTEWAKLLADNSDPSEYQEGRSRRAYFKKRDELSRKLKLARFTKRLATVRMRARDNNEPEYSALREVFRLGLDIHTYTAMGLNGMSPGEVFAGLTPEEITKTQKRYKEEIGDLRKSGKVANLGLGYAMGTKGFRDFAAKGFNIHWSDEEAESIKETWLDTYPEVDLWHIWTDLNPLMTVWMPDADRGGKLVKKDVHLVTTLGGRELYAFGLNSALAFPDQGTGADVLGLFTHMLKEQCPDIFDMYVNQVHDETVFCIPESRKDEITDTCSRLMNEAFEVFVSSYGVPAANSPAIGRVWLKD
jgi:hypothetical protein